MNLLACVASYAREVAQTQPLACAKLLTFERVADYRAVLARAYLAAVERAEAAERELAALRAKVAQIARAPSAQSEGSK